MWGEKEGASPRRAPLVHELPDSLSTVFNWRPGPRLADGVLSGAVSAERYGRAAAMLELHSIESPGVPYIIDCS